MSDTPIRVLLVEDNPGDARLIQEAFREADGSFAPEWCDRLSAAHARLARGGVDVVLLDLSLPDASGLDTVVKTLVEAPHVPIVVLTGLDSERVACESVRLGAQDYLVKARVTGDLLARALRYAIERHRMHEDLRRVAVMEDRDRIAADLHDDVIQSLVGVGLMLKDMAESSEYPEIREKVGKSADELRRVATSVREYVYALADPKAGPLERVLRGLADTLRATHGVTIAVNVDPGVARVLESQGAVLAQVVREALSNVGRHARAETCHVTLRRQGDSAVLEIRDDGRGFIPADADGSGRGLRNLRKRASAIGGALELESTTGGGTVVRLTVPVPQAGGLGGAGGHVRHRET